MYSYEDGIRAVKLYIKLGKRTSATIRQLGYPTKNALKSWHREYEQGGNLRSSHRPLPNLVQHLNHLRHPDREKQCLRPLLADVRERRLVKPGRVHHAVFRQVLHDEVNELQLAGRGGRADDELAERLACRFPV